MNHQSRSPARPQQFLHIPVQIPYLRSFFHHEVSILDVERPCIPHCYVLRRTVQLHPATQYTLPARIEYDWKLLRHSLAERHKIRSRNIALHPARPWPLHLRQPRRSLETTASLAATAASNLKYGDLVYYSAPSP